MRVAEQRMLPYGANPQNLANSATRQDYHHRSIKINARSGIPDAASRRYRWCKRAAPAAVRNHRSRTPLRLRSRLATSANGLLALQLKRFYEGKGASEQKQFFRARIFPKRRGPELNGHDAPDRKCRRRCRSFPIQSFFCSKTRVRTPRESRPV